MTENGAPETEDQPCLIPEVAEAEAEEKEERRKRGLANLRMWSPGESGNPDGRVKGGAYVNEWINALLICGPNGHRYTVDEIQAIAESGESAPAAKMAARRVLSAMRDGTKWGEDAETGEFYPMGTDPEPGRDFDRIMDRLGGKPAQSIQVNQTIERKQTEIESEIGAMLTAEPALLAYLAANPALRSILEAAAGRPEIVAESPALPADVHAESAHPGEERAGE